MRRTLPVLLLVGAFATAAPAQEKPPGFWTEDELRRIDEGLAVVNASRADLGFSKQLLDDPFRLDVVRRALDAPLSIGDEAQGWADVSATEDPRRLLERASRDLDLTLSPLPEYLGIRVGWDAPLPESVREALDVVVAAVGLHQRSFPVERLVRADAERLAREALLSQVEEPAAAVKADDVDDAAFLRELPTWNRARDAALARSLTVWAGASVEVLRKLPVADLAAVRATRLTTPAGDVVLYGTGDDVHAADESAVLVIDLGGNDTYLRGASANLLEDRPVQVVIDLSGDDRYVGGNDFSFGGALGGVAIQWDCAGNDVYLAGHASLGAGILGVGVLVDEGGDDVFRAKDFCQGAGAYGIGVFLKKGGNDLYHGDRFAQGYASTWGCGVLADTGGNDTYDAGGAHIHAPLYRDRYQSLSQGFAIGSRPDASGGVGVLVDLAGNDRYVADIYAQGSSYWFSLGLLIDGDGHDTYVAGQYSQGAGIHLSAGMLLDLAGNDSYHCANGVGVGGAHDLAVGLLVDRGGDDHYSGSGASQGCGHTNSVGLLLDAGGDDAYTAVRDLVQGDASWVRNTGGIGLLLDAGGKDAYSERAQNDGVRVRGTIGVLVDEPTASVATGEPQAASITKEEAEAKVEAEGKVVLNDGDRAWDLDKLWALASQWEVNDNRVILPIARERLFALPLKDGKVPALERAFERLGSGSVGSGLEFRAVEATVTHFAKDDGRAPVVARLLDATRSDDVAVRKGAVSLLATLKATEAVERMAEMLRTDDATRRGVLAALGALKAAPPEVATFLPSRNELEGVNAAVALGAAGDDASVAALASAIGGTTPFLTRTAATEQLALLGEKALARLSAIARDDAADVTARRNALRALGRSKHADAVDPILDGLRSRDRWVRLSSVLAARALAETANDVDRQELLTTVASWLSLEKDPLVLRLR